MKLYELSQSYQELLQLAEEGHDVLDTLESIHEAIEQKLENICKVHNTLNKEAEAIAEEEKRLHERKKSIQSQMTTLKQYTETQMILTGINKIKGQLFTLSIQKNPPSVEILDETLIPEQYFKVTTTVDKKSLLEALQQHEIEGARIQQTESLRIR